FDSRAEDVSADGSVVVGYSHIGGSITSDGGFRWEAGVMTRLPDLPGGRDNGRAYAVSADGRIVGGRGTIEDGEGEDVSAAVRWVDGVPEGLGFPPEATGLNTYDMSADGRRVTGEGIYIVPGPPYGWKTFLWEEGEGIRWLEEPCPYSHGRAISGDGRVIAGAPPLGGCLQEHFLWTEQTGLRTLRSVLEDHGIDLAGWTSLSIGSKGLSYDGRVIVGSGINPEGNREAWRVELPPWPVATEPEPPAAPLTLAVTPNPSRGAATLTLTPRLPGAVRVAVYDVLGREVALLHTGSLAAGSHTFSLGSAALPPGVYFVRAEAGRHVITRALTVLR
ncbi:MAG TPA: T9SS type A sorting domain-containing protein, partial [Rubricoccaceae bacterium]|nr:T9SS type A sorting domain-containing protein [Rubricoccaceae bacterium]